MGAIYIGLILLCRVAQHLCNKTASNSVGTVPSFLKYCTFRNLLGLVLIILGGNGFQGAESILNEWNYVKNWTDRYIYTIKAIHGIKGAAFMMATISEAAYSSIDMLMYYDMSELFVRSLRFLHL